MINAKIQALYATGNTLYAVLIDPETSKFYNNMMGAWEAYNPAHWGVYAVPMAEAAGSGYYSAFYPIPPNSQVLSTDIIYAQAGVSPTLGDVVASNIYASQGVNIGAVGNSAQAGQSMGFALGTQQVGAVNGTPGSPTLIPTNLANAQVGAYAGRAFIMASGVLAQQASLITGYDGAGSLTIVPLPSGGTPASGDVFVIV